MEDLGKGGVQLKGHRLERPLALASQAQMATERAEWCLMCEDQKDTMMLSKIRPHDFGSLGDHIGAMGLVSLVLV